MSPSGTRRRPWIALLAGVAAFSAGAAVAQVSIEPPPQFVPAPAVQLESASQPTVAPAPATLPSAESVLQNLLREKDADGTARVTPSTNPAATGTSPITLREGQIIDMRRGHLQKDPDSSAMLFVFDDNQSPAYPPMRIVPSRRLASLEDASEFGAKPVSFRIEAEVTQYRGKNYLYIKPTVMLAAASTGPAASPVPPTVSPSAPAAANASKPATTSIEPVAPTEPLVSQVREGQTVYNRVGRLVQDEKTGVELFVYDSDGNSMYDPPMGLIPCQGLALMEDASDKGSRPVKFRVSGTVTQYRGKSYLYIRFVQAVRNLGQGLGG